MKKQWTILALLISAAASLIAVNYFYPNSVLQKGAATALALAIVYFAFKPVIEDKLIKRIRLSERRYYLYKVSYLAYVFVIIIIFFIIWVENIQGLLFGFGLVAAAFTISLQDVAKNFAGGSNILFNGIYRVGDRIEIGSKKGDVIDIGMLYTTIMEIEEWVGGTQPTGRLSTIPNGYVLNSVVNNYTRNFNFLWDEIIIPITYESDWRAARNRILDIVRRETLPYRDVAEEEIRNLELKYFISKGSIEADIFIKLTDNWIELTARYVVPARQKRITKSKLSRMILEEIEAAENIKIASMTVDIVGLPELRLNKGRDAN